MTLIGCRCNYSNVFSRAVLIARALFFSPDLYVLCDIKAQIYTFSIYSITFSVIVVNDWNVITLKELFFVQGLWLSNIKAIDSVGDPPLPIPNREVKPNSADGTAFSCGRVGHRHFFSEELWLILRLFFFCIYYFMSLFSNAKKLVAGFIRLPAQGNTLFPREVKHLIYHWSADGTVFSLCGVE